MYEKVMVQKQELRKHRDGVGELTLQKRNEFFNNGTGGMKTRIATE